MVLALGEVRQVQFTIVILSTMIWELNYMIILMQIFSVFLRGSKKFIRKVGYQKKDKEG